MLDIILDTLIDSLKLLPFLFLSYLIIEWIEQTSSNKLEKILKKSGKFGAFFGSILGCIPQCGFSVTASNLYSGRVITLGTLISVFLSTSDEALPVLLSHPGNMMEIIKILGVKVLIGMIAGIIIDFILRKKQNAKLNQENTDHHIHEMCSHSHCDCEKSGILKSTITHTVHIFFFILIVAFLLNTSIHFIGEERLSTFLMTGTIFQPIVAGIIGLIPNCAASILLTELYIAGKISFASIITGLCSSAGIGLIVLFKSNKNIKENFKILGLTYGISVFAGIMIEIITYFVK